jgi:hypothetical protein
MFCLQLLLAYICAPHSCEWGNGTYFYFGVGCAAVSFILPFFQKQWKIFKRVGLALVLALASAGLWIGGFMLFDFRIICRLF